MANSNYELSNDMRDACSNQDLDIISNLLGKIQDSERKCALSAMAHAAVSSGQLKVLDLCLQQGVQPDRELGMEAIVRGDIEAYRALMHAGLDVNEDYDFRGDALILAIATRQLEVVNFLIDSGAELDSDRLWHYGYVPLAVASMVGTVDILSLLISRGAIIQNSLALHNAAGMGRLDMLERLLEEGADVNENPLPDHDSTWPSKIELGPPIHYAATARHLEAVEFLLNHGADATLLDLAGRNVLDRSFKEGEVWHELEDVLVQRAISLDNLHSTPQNLDMSEALPSMDELAKRNLHKL